MDKDEIDMVEIAIQKNIPWSKLSEDIRIVLGGSVREYDKRILDYSIKNQLRYTDNIVRHVKKCQQEYYEALLNYSQSRMVLYPYHLSDILVRELRVTPFTYYINMMVDLMEAEKSYDSLPNFTAIDAMHILGIGRNQYIDLVNQNRTNRKFFRRTKTVREILPSKPIGMALEPWYLVCYGCVLEDDIRSLISVEKNTIDQLLDNGAMLCGNFDKFVLQRLIVRGLVYIDVPIQNDDHVFVQPLNGFVMNRVQGDYFENLLYKIFVAIDGQSTVQELSETIGIDIDLVKNAISVFCRLDFARKRITGLEGDSTLNESWLKLTPSSSTLISSPSLENTAVTVSECVEFLNLGMSTDFDDEDLLSAVDNALKHGTVDQQLTISQTFPIQAASSELPQAKRLAFVFDSTLTAFLMMGNLSTSLKNHAVTLFEVGKLNDEAVDDFITELKNINFFAEGEAQRYFEHAKALLHTLQSLRESGNEFDLIRGESLLNLEEKARLKVLQKSYKLIISMAPLNSEACCVQTSTIPYLGTNSVVLTSWWFRLYLYEVCGCGPPSLLIPAGYRLNRLPKPFWKSSHLLVQQGSHEALIVPSETALFMINESLTTSTVFLQSYRHSFSTEIGKENDVVNIPFPVDDSLVRNKVGEKQLNCHPSVSRLRESLNLDTLCGYIVLLKYRQNENPSNNENIESDQTRNTEYTAEQKALDSTVFYPPNINSSLVLNVNESSKASTYRVELESHECFDDYILLDCIFGVPLFDESLNKIICQQLVAKLACTENFKTICDKNEFIANSMAYFLKRFLGDHHLIKQGTTLPHPTRLVFYDNLQRRCFFPDKTIF